MAQDCTGREIEVGDLVEHADKGKGGNMRQCMSYGMANRTGRVLRVLRTAVVLDMGGPIPCHLGCKLRVVEGAESSRETYERIGPNQKAV